MSVKDFNLQIVVTNATTGVIIDVIDLNNYDVATLGLMIQNLFKNDYDNKQGLIIKYGYKNYS